MSIGYLTLPGGTDDYAYTSDNIPVGPDLLNVSIFDVALNDWTTGSDQTLAAKWGETGNQRSWRLYINGAGDLAFDYSTDGTAAEIVSITSVPSISVTGGALTSLQVIADMINGTIQFYQSEFGGEAPEEFVLISEADDTLDIYDGTAATTVGGLRAPAGDTSAGIIGAVSIGNVLSGSAYTDPTFTIAEGETSFLDSYGNTWHLSGSASFEIDLSDVEISAGGSPLKALYPSVRDAVLRGEINVLDGNLTLQALSGRQTFNENIDAFLDDLESAYFVGDPWPLENVSIIETVVPPAAFARVTADDAFTNADPTAPSAAKAVVIYYDTGVPATSRLIAWLGLQADASQPERPPEEPTVWTFPEEVFSI